MPFRFGEEITNDDAYAVARNATTHMSNETLAQQAGQSMGENQAKAVADEQAARQANS